LGAATTVTMTMMAEVLGCFFLGRTMCCIVVHEGTCFLARAARDRPGMMLCRVLPRYCLWRTAGTHPNGRQGGCMIWGKVFHAVAESARYLSRDST
jgi:hypothetical protein